MNAHKTNGLISDKRLCVDEDCTELISLAKTLLRYSAPEHSILSFKINENVKIFSKEAGSRLDLWGVEINGKRGYVPKHLVREYKVLTKPTKIVDTELSKKTEVPVEKLPEEKVDPDKVKHIFEVVDGTTIPFDSIVPSSTENPVLSTATNSLNKQETPSIDEEKEAVQDKNLEKQTPEVETKVEKGDNPLPSVEDVTVDTKEKTDGSIFSTFTKWVKDDGFEDDEDGEDEEEGDEEEDENEANEESLTVEDNNKKYKMESPTMSNENPTLNKEIEDISIDSVTNITHESTKTSHAFNETEQYNDIPEKIVSSKENDIKSTLVDEKTTEDINILKENGVNPTKSEDDILSKNIPEPMQVDPIPLVPIEVNPILKVPTEEYPKSEAETKENVSTTGETNNIGIVQIAQNNLNTATEVKEAVKKEDESNTSENIGEAREETETSFGNIEATTLSSIDNEEALPILSAESVTINPIEVTPSSVVEQQQNVELIDKKPEDISPGNQDGSLDTKSSTDASLPVPANLASTKVESEPPQNEDSKFPAPAETTYQPVKTDFQKVRENLFGRHLNNLQEKIVDVESNVEENITVSSSPDDIKEINEPTVSSEAETQTESELPLQQVAPQEDSESSETPTLSSWYGNVNTNIDTSSEINEHSEIPQDVTQNNDIPSDIQINSLRNSEGILPNNLLGENQDEGVLIEETVLKVDSGGIFGSLFSFFEKDAPANEPKVDTSPSTPIGNADKLLRENNQHTISERVDSPENGAMLDKLTILLNSDILLYLITTAVSCIIFLFVYMLIDKSSREAPLIKKINNLEKELLISLKEKDILQDGASDLSKIPTEEIDFLKRKLEETEILKQNLEMQVLSLQQEVETKKELEEQIESLERELETSTEVGMELNRIISDMLNPSNGGEKLKENVEQLQRQLSEQKWIINDITKSLDDKEKENAALHVQLDETKKKSSELQKKLDEIVDQILKIEKERDQQQKTLQDEISMYQLKYSDEMMKEDLLNTEIRFLKTQLADAKRKAELKIKEYESLKESLNGFKFITNDNDALESLLNATTLKAELQQLKSESENYLTQLKQEEAAKIAFENKCQAVMEENNSLLNKYQESDKLKLEANMKLEVLNNYFKKREEELQSEILKYKSIWDAKEGEATSTTERIKLMAEEIENYKSQNETLKQEIVSQEIDLKSQISILEKKVHENWVTSRQMERKLEDAKQEAAQLRNRLTRERTVNDERLQNRLQSPIDQNGELTLSPPPIESPTSQLLFGGRDHITKSPPLPGLPPFLPPPPGAPFMPPPLHGMPFMPPPPALFPGDHRPPPLGRMSSPPPLNSRYSPDTSAFSPYERNTPSPPYDSEYGASPPPIREYSPYRSRDDRRDYKRPIHVSNGRNNKGSPMSSESDHSNDSLDKVNRKHSSKMV